MEYYTTMILVITFILSSDMISKTFILFSYTTSIHEVVEQRCHGVMPFNQMCLIQQVFENKHIIIVRDYAV